MKIYVGTYAKYNRGSIEGAWLDLEDYNDKDEFEEACVELHADEDDPEFMFQDWEGVPAQFITESHVDEVVWEILSYLNESYADEDVLAAYLYLFDGWDEDDLNERYIGQFDSAKDLAYQLVDEQGLLVDAPEFLQNYFDYEAYGHDLVVGGDVVQHDGYWFWNH